MAKTHNDLWKGRKILNAADGQTLESAAAVKEFRDGLPREHAEERAYDDYRRGHLEDARAHHHAGAQAALAVGDHDAAHKHGMMYDLLTRAVGKDPMAGVEPDLQARLEANKAKHYKFRAHRGDGFIVHEMHKAEEASKVEPEMSKPASSFDAARHAAASRPFEPIQKDAGIGDGTSQDVSPGSVSND